MGYLSIKKTINPIINNLISFFCETIFSSLSELYSNIKNREKGCFSPFTVFMVLDLLGFYRCIRCIRICVCWLCWFCGDGAGSIFVIKSEAELPALSNAVALMIICRPP